MTTRLFLLLALASLLTVSYGLDCLVCTDVTNSDCESNPSSINATTCPSGSNAFCQTVKVTSGGSTTSFARACAALELAPGCLSALGISTCNTYCTTDGCNNGSGAGTVRASALFLLVSAVLAKLLH
ncbi:hypothetical protein Bbelb_333760 [Branchiostoma belcheri]|nr:hypothetical protein Bbelb_333760 [Branchiostoma belcheri]